ncbi:MAG: PAS domain-containing protein, partial [Oceanicaulis sp.]|nr:PAS domain-containing protein [Oceanicaulis sp.]
EDRDKVMSAISEALDSRDGRLSLSHRIVRADGDVIWLQVDGATIRRDEQGRARS